MMQKYHNHMKFTLQKIE